MDQETIDTLLQVIERLKVFRERYDARREKLFWRDICIPCSFPDLIGGLTKEEMNKIRKSYGFKRLSSLKKSELASKLVELVPMRFAKTLYALDQGRYSLLKAVVRNQGMLKGMDLETKKAQVLLNACLLFPGTYNDEKVLYMPPELVDIFTRTDNAELEMATKRNTEWITLTHGMLYYYGVVGIHTLIKKIGQLTGDKVDFLEYIGVLTPAMNFYGQARYSAQGLCNHRVLEVEKLVDEHRSRQGVDYYPFTKRQLIKASVPDYIERTPAMNAFLRFLAEHYDLSEEEKNEIALQLIGIINIDGKIDNIIKYLDRLLEFPSFDFVQLLTAKIMELHNNTRQWALKGHTPSELFQEERRFLKPLPEEPFSMGQLEPVVVDIKTRKKIGRNDPCPCGSGKKFKKCCGR